MIAVAAPAVERIAGPPPPEADAYTPRGAVRDLFYCKDPEVLLEGPAGTGKSRGALEKIHLLCSLYPRIRVLICRLTRESLTETVLVTWEDEVLGPGHPLRAGPDRAYRKRYTYPNGSIVVVAGLDTPGKVLSSQYDLIYVPEATEIPLASWETLTTRNRHFRLPYQQAIADANPSYPRHWLNQRAAAGTMRRLRSRHTDNPRLWNAQLQEWTAEGRAYLATLARLTGARLLRFLKGLWAAAEGLVYDEWDPAIHLIDPFPIPPEWPRYRLVDFGYTNPFVCQWWATDGDGRLYLYRELVCVQTLVEDATAEIITLSAGETFAGDVIADHDAEDRATMEAHGLRTTPAHKAISPGIQALQARLRPAGDGKPRLFVLRGGLVRRDPRLGKAPVGLAEEIEGYVWAPGADGKPNKEAPVDKDNHSLDTARYVVAALDLYTSPGVF